MQKAPPDLTWAARRHSRAAISAQAQPEHPGSSTRLEKPGRRSFRCRLATATGMVADVVLCRMTRPIWALNVLLGPSTTRRTFAVRPVLPSSHRRSRRGMKPNGLVRAILSQPLEARSLGTTLQQHPHPSCQGHARMPDPMVFHDPSQENSEKTVLCR